MTRTVLLIWSRWTERNLALSQARQDEHAVELEAASFYLRETNTGTQKGVRAICGDGTGRCDGQRAHASC